MTLPEALLLGILQGITEFLPISSSGHLILGESFLGLAVEDLKSFDVFVHVGTLLAILLFFRKDLLEVKRWPFLIIGTIPAVFVGLFLGDEIDAIFRSALAVGIVMFTVGAIFMIPELFKIKEQDKKLTFGRAILVGIAQAIAIIPGVSRSGSTIFTGTMLGMNRQESARFSFLLGSIAIAGAGLLTALDMGSEATLQWEVLLVGLLSAFISGLIAVKWLMKYLQNHSLKVFGIYLMGLGAIVVFAQII